MKERIKTLCGALLIGFVITCVILTIDRAGFEPAFDKICGLIERDDATDIYGSCLSAVETVKQRLIIERFFSWLAAVTTVFYFYAVTSKSK